MPHQLEQHRHRGRNPMSGEAPVGSVTAFAGIVGAPQPASASPATVVQAAGAYTTDPLEAWGWMLCDGRVLQASHYPDLFWALGYLYGGAGDTFHIPDYRGTFLRGTDYGAGKDPDLPLRTAADGGAGQDQGVGSRQSAAMLLHCHDYNAVPAAVTPSSSGSTGSGKPAPATTSAPVDANNQLIKAGAGISDSETRPMNTAVNFLIKFTYWRPHAGPGPALP